MDSYIFLNIFNVFSLDVISCEFLKSDVLLQPLKQTFNKLVWIDGRFNL